MLSEVSVFFALSIRASSSSSIAACHSWMVVTISWATASVASASWGRWHLAQPMRCSTFTSFGLLTPEAGQSMRPFLIAVMKVAAVRPVPKMERECTERAHWSWASWWHSTQELES